MKKIIKKLISNSLKQIRLHKEEIKKFKFSNYREDFVITEQEEKEGGYFGSLNFKIS
jgi:hypothetical protein